MLFTFISYFKDSFPNNFMAYRPPMSQTLSSSATSVTFYYIGVSVAEPGVTQVIGSVTGGVSNNDLSYTLSGNVFDNNNNEDITIALGQGINSNTASAVNVRYTINIRGKTCTTIY